MSAEISQQLAEMFLVLKGGLIGEIEFRNGLENLPGWEWFKDARDPDVDNNIRELGLIEDALAKARGDGYDFDSEEEPPS